MTLQPRDHKKHPRKCNTRIKGIPVPKCMAQGISRTVSEDSHIPIKGIFQWCFKAKTWVEVLTLIINRVKSYNNHQSQNLLLSNLKSTSTKNLSRRWRTVLYWKSCKTVFRLALYQGRVFQCETFWCAWAEIWNKGEQWEESKKKDFALFGTGEVGGY